MSERETASTTRGKIASPATALEKSLIVATGGTRGTRRVPVLGAVLGDISVELERLHSLHQGIHLSTVEQGNVIPSAEHEGTKP